MSACRYIVTADPSDVTGGVSASFAMFGDYHPRRSRAPSSASPVPASSKKPSARNCPKASSAPNIFWSTAWSTWSFHRKELKETLARIARLLDEHPSRRAIGRKVEAWRYARRAYGDRPNVTRGQRSRILARLLKRLHPKLIDLRLDRVLRLLAAPRQPARPAAAGRSMSPAPTARARPSRSCAQCHRRSRGASASMSIPPPHLVRIAERIRVGRQADR